MDNLFTSITSDIKMNLPLKIALIKASIIFDKFKIPPALELLYKIKDTIKSLEDGKQTLADITLDVLNKLH